MDDSSSSGEDPSELTFVSLLKPVGKNRPRTDLRHQADNRPGSPKNSRRRSPASNVGAAKESFPQHLRLSGDAVAQAATGGAAHRRSGFRSTLDAGASPANLMLRRPTSSEMIRKKEIESDSAIVTLQVGERSCCEAHPPKRAGPEETTEDFEIAELRSQVAELQMARTARKADMKEYRHLQKNCEVVTKEFGMSLHNLEADVIPMREETERLRVAYESARAALDEKEAQVAALKEVLHDKAIDTDSYQTALADLRAEDAVDAGLARELRFSLDHKEHRELSQLSQRYVAASAAGSGELTASMALHNHIEERVREQCIPAIPDGFRGAVWQALAPLTRLKQAEGRSAGHLYYTLLERFSGFEQSIDKDILRTFPNEEFRQILLVDNNTGKLSNVLKAYSCWDTALGYCQGMNFIVGMLLCYMDQEAAFWMLVSILTHDKMLGLFQKECPLLPYFLNAFEHELRVHLPRLASHFRAEDVGAVMYVTEWFTTMFVYSLPRETCAAVWDLFFIGDGTAALFKCAIAILAILEENLLILPMEGIVMELKKKSKHIGVATLMKKQRSVILTRPTQRLLSERVEVKWAMDRGIKSLVCIVHDDETEGNFL